MAERKCKDEKEQERCDELQANPVEVLIDRYYKDCRHCEPKDKDKDKDYGNSGTSTAV
jgi:hypothetical protein